MCNSKSNHKGIAPGVLPQADKAAPTRRKISTAPLPIHVVQRRRRRGGDRRSRAAGAHALGKLDEQLVRLQCQGCLSLGPRVAQLVVPHLREAVRDDHLDARIRAPAAAAVLGHVPLLHQVRHARRGSGGDEARIASDEVLLEGEHPRVRFPEPTAAGGVPEHRCASARSAGRGLVEAREPFEARRHDVHLQVRRRSRAAAAAAQEAGSGGAAAAAGADRGRRQEARVETSVEMLRVPPVARSSVRAHL
mmetsp:Transcript_17584/g.56989  ORF Transcript_17584/g.56989 Transcript_17584/m.56989 type:complete len:249 (+) Transcript_17584:487-1233(+)